MGHIHEMKPRGPHGYHLQPELTLTQSAKASGSKNDHDQRVKITPDEHYINITYVDSIDRRASELLNATHKSGGSIPPEVEGDKLHSNKDHVQGKAMAPGTIQASSGLNLKDFFNNNSQTQSCDSRQLNLKFSNVKGSDKGLTVADICSGNSVSGGSHSSGGQRKAGKKHNDDSKRTRKEADSHKMSAGGSNKKNMGDNSSQVVPVAPVEPGTKDNAKPVVIYLATDDLEFMEWGSHIGITPSWNHTVAKYAHRVSQMVGLGTVTESGIAAALHGFSIAAISVSAGLLAYKTQSSAPFYQRCINIASASITSGALAVVAGAEIVKAPQLLGAGAPIVCVSEIQTFSPAYNQHKYTSRRSGVVYRHVRDKLMAEFTGCTPDSHLCSRMLKRGFELAGKHYTGTFDQGVLADTVSFVACVLQITLSRAVSSTVTTGAMPVVQWL